MEIAFRSKWSSTSATLQIRSFYTNDFLNNISKPSSFEITEDTEKVDGIGGTSWNGSLVLGIFAQSLLSSKKNECNVLELGCGSGISGILCALVGANVISTDREIDLVSDNIDKVKKIYSHLHMECQTLEWSEEINPNLKDIHFDVILGAEIACLRKQHSYLVNTIDSLAGPTTDVYISFDGKPSESDYLYSREFDARMIEKGFSVEIVGCGMVLWSNSGTNNTKCVFDFPWVVQQTSLKNESLSYWDTTSLYLQSSSSCTTSLDSLSDSMLPFVFLFESEAEHHHIKHYRRIEKVQS